MEEYNLPLGLDIQKVIQQAQTVKSALNEINTVAVNVGQNAKQAFDATAQAAVNAEKVTVKQAEAFGKTTRSIENMKDALNDLKRMQFEEKDTAKIRYYNQEIQKLERQIRQTSNIGKAGFDEVGNKIGKVTEQVKKQVGYYDTLVNRIKIYQDAIKVQPNTEQGVKNVAALNAAIERSTNELNRLKNIGKSGFDELGNKIDQTKPKIEKVTESSYNLGNTLKSLASAFGVAFSLSTLVQFGKDLFDIAVKADGIERAFSRIGDSKSLAKLRTETKGFVSDLDLEKLTVKANNFNIPLEKLGTFLDFAQQRAKATGEDVDKLTNNIIDGLGRKSSRIIDNLGISIVDIQKEFARTGDFTTAVSNLIQKEMQSSGSAVDTLADKTNRASTTWENFKQTIAGALTALFNPDLADNDIIAKYTQRQLKTIGDFSKKSAEERAKIIADQRELIGRTDAVFKNAQANIDKYVQSNGKLSASYYDQAAAQKKTAGENLAAQQNVLQTLIKQNSEVEKNLRIQKGILSVEELKAKVTDLRDEALNIVPTTEADKNRRKELLKQADEFQKQIDEVTGKAEKKRDKDQESAAKKREQRQKELNAELLRLNSELNSAQLEAIEDATAKALKTEQVQSENKINDLKNRKTLYPELEKEINRNIEYEQQQSVLRQALITKKGQEEQIKIRKASQTEIARVLKQDTDVQIEEINDRYDLIRQNAVKAGTLTTQVQRRLAEAQTKEINDVTIAGQNKILKDQEELALSGIFLRKRKEGQTEKSFERQNQTDILNIQIDFAKKRLALIEADPAKLKEANDLRKAIQDAQNQIDKNSKSQGTDLLETLGIDPEKIDTYTAAFSKVGELASGLFGTLADAAQLRVDAIQQQIDAIDQLIDKQQEAVDKEKDLMDKGFANNYQNAQRTLNAQKQQREQLIKEQQEAQKKQQDLQRAQIVFDGLAQVSNLVTASSEIFKVFSKIPVIGIPLAIAAIATMFGAFAAAKVTALDAVGANNKFAEGGTIGGKSHAEGGNRYISIDGNGGVSMMEHERGEEVIKKSSAQKHRKLLKAINADDFSGLGVNDVSLKELLRGTGVYAQLEEAKTAGENNIVLTERSRTIVIGDSKSEKYLHSIDQRLKKIERQNEEKSQVLDFGDYYLIKRGNNTEKIWKK